MGIDGDIKIATQRLGGGVIKTTRTTKGVEKDSSAYRRTAAIEASEKDKYTSVDQISISIDPGRKLRTFEFPSDAQVFLFDATCKLKHWTNPYIKNGQDYVLDYVLAEATSFLKLPRAEAAMLCFDRGSPPNKDEEHSDRYKDVQFLDLNAIPDSKVLISDSVIHPSSDWEGFTNHPKLKQELSYYITNKILEPSTLRTHKHYTPPVNKCLFLFGGTTIAPIPDRKKRGFFRPDPHLYFVTNEVEKKSLDDAAYMVEHCRRHGLFSQAESGYSPEAQANLLEGEMSVLYFAKPYTATGKNVFIMTVDGDLLIQLLMECRDRIDPSTGRFKNKVYLRLVVPRNGDYTDFDMNAMYFNLVQNPLFIRAGVSDPGLTIAIASCLKKNDFFSGFAFGIGTANADSDTSCPYILYTLLTFLKQFGKTMVLDDYRPTANGASILENVSNGYPLVHLRVDENVFYQFTQYLYVVKYREAAKKKQEKQGKKGKKELSLPVEYDYAPFSIDNNAIKKVELYLAGLADKRKQIPSREQTNVYARMLEWALCYFYNGYRGSCVLPNPLFSVKGVPYYGWEISSNNATNLDENDCSCRQAKIVSKSYDTESPEDISLREALRASLFNVQPASILLNTSTTLTKDETRKRKADVLDENAEVEQSPRGSTFDVHDSFLLQEPEKAPAKRQCIRAESILPILRQDYPMETPVSKRALGDLEEFAKDSRAFFRQETPAEVPKAPQESQPSESSPKALCPSFPWISVRPPNLLIAPQETKNTFKTRLHLLGKGPELKGTSDNKDDL